MTFERQKYRENNLLKIIAVAVVVFSSAPLWAAKVNNPKCEDLEDLNYKLTPEYIAVIDGYNQRGKMTNDQVDFAGIVTESNKVKAECAKDKTAKVQAIRKEIMKTAKNNVPQNTLQEDIDRKPKSAINPTKAKCSDFLALGEEYQPVAAFWVAGHSKAGKVKTGEIDEEYLGQPVATLVEDCKATPTASFYDKAKTWFKKHI